MQSQLKITADGSHTLYVPEMDEQYHSINGAITESDYVYLGKGYRFCQKAEPVVLEIGFGTGLNCLLTALEAEKLKRKTIYIGIEKFPISEKTMLELNYGSIYPGGLFAELHRLPWGKLYKVSPFFEVLKLEKDLTTFGFSLPQPADVVYFDAFGPDKQPEMWSQFIFKNIYACSSNNSVFVTYSAKGEVRRSLASVGYTMERLAGPPGKKEMLRGIKGNNLF